MAGSDRHAAVGGAVVSHPVSVFGLKVVPCVWFGVRVGIYESYLEYGAPQPSQHNTTTRPPHARHCRTMEAPSRRAMPSNAAPGSSRGWCAAPLSSSCASPSPIARCIILPALLLVVCLGQCACQLLHHSSSPYGPWEPVVPKGCNGSTGIWRDGGGNNQSPFYITAEVAAKTGLPEDSLVAITTFGLLNRSSPHSYANATLASCFAVGIAKNWTLTNTCAFAGSKGAWQWCPAQVARSCAVVHLAAVPRARAARVCGNLLA